MIPEARVMEKWWMDLDYKLGLDLFRPCLLSFCGVLMPCVECYVCSKTLAIHLIVQLICQITTPHLK